MRALRGWSEKQWSGSSIKTKTSVKNCSRLSRRVSATSSVGIMPNTTSTRSKILPKTCTSAGSRELRICKKPVGDEASGFSARQSQSRFNLVVCLQAGWCGARPTQRLIEGITEKLPLLAAQPGIGRRRDDLKPGCEAYPGGPTVSTLLSKTGTNLTTRVANGGFTCPELEF